MAQVLVRGLGPLGEVRAGDEIAELIMATPLGAQLRDGQLVAIAHKVVSKAEGAVVALADVEPSAQARRIAAAQERDARVVQVVLDESAEVLRAERDVIISRTRHGFVCANAGVDASNASERGHRDPAAARPRRLRAAHPRASCASWQAPAWACSSATASGAPGATDRSTPASGSRECARWTTGAVAPMRGGLELQATWIAVADAAAAVADLARAKDSREPVVLIDGLERYLGEHDGPGAAELLRAPAEDLFL